MAFFLKKIFGTEQSRRLKKFSKIVKEINTIEKALVDLSDDELKQKTEIFKKRYEEGETLDALLPEAFAVVKNTCRRLCGTAIKVSGYHQKWDMIPYDEQLIGAIVLHQGMISEMQTGEGKTLTASLPLYLNALTGKPVHLVTVNDYLAKRDCEWIGVIFRYLGLSVKFLTNEIPPQERQEVYKADIVYGTASEFGFDYLRDNSMAHSLEEQCQRGYFFAIIDEVDSILIDEARTPLIISGPSHSTKQLYDTLKDPVSQLVRIQRDHCNTLATEARKILDQLGRLAEDPIEKLSKEDVEKESEALRKLWLVSKGTPQNKILKRLKENPDLRADLEKWETYFHSEPNKEERMQALAELYIVVDERSNEFELTDKGIQTWSQRAGGNQDDFTMLDLGDGYAKIDQDQTLSDQDKLQQKVALREEDSQRKERAHNLRQLFRAHLMMEKDVDYIVQNKKIVIIDENTGRPQAGRRFSDGLHQAIEAKEHVPIQQETQTYATVTLQNYFRMYEKTGGMTGTAITEAAEFKQIYGMDVLEIPTHKTCIRKDADDEVYMTEREKYQALLKDISDIHHQGRPILIGTESVEVSEKLSRILKQNRLKHTVLNAKNHESEAEIIAQAGQKGAITVATNMAGRGTDIKLEKGVAEIGGLHVIGTTRHQSRRIDRQLRGRCARQGDPGSSKFYVSFEDALMRLFTSPKLTTFLTRFRPPEGEPISAKILNRSIETAQKRVEQRNYSMRKHTLEYDDVMNKQRQEVYAFRNDVLREKNPMHLVREILESMCCYISEPFFISRHDDTWNPAGFRDEMMTHFPVTFDSHAFDDDYSSLEDIEKEAFELVFETLRKKLEHEAHAIEAAYHASKQTIDAKGALEGIMRSLLLSKIDYFWQNHLLNIDHLRTEVNLRVIGQKDPLLEFKHEAFALFDTFSRTLKFEIGHVLFKFEVGPPLSQASKAPTKRQKKPRGFLSQEEEPIADHGGLYIPSPPVKTHES